MTMVVDVSQALAALRDMDLSEEEVVNLAGVPAAVLKNGMRIRVPVDTSATQNSIQSHLVEASSDRVVDEVGPETNYAPFIELGIPSVPAYPIQPFVRPTADEDFAAAEAATSAALVGLVRQKWPK